MLRDRLIEVLAIEGCVGLVASILVAEVFQNRYGLWEGEI